MARELTGACWVVGRGLREEQEEEGDIGVKEREIALRRCQEVANMALGLGRTVAAGSKLVVPPFFPPLIATHFHKKTSLTIT